MSARSLTLVPDAIDAARAREGRIDELDAVRGIAALVVVLHHCWQALLPDQNTFPFVLGALPITAQARWAAWINLSPLKLLFAGHPAVGLFFVLSGLVLTKQLQGARHLGYGQFVIRRFFRIWVPFAIVILVAALLCQRLGGPLVDLPWINESWSAVPGLSLVAGHLLMLGTSYYVSLDNPMWSLVHELRISLVFPLIARLAERAWRPLLFASLGLFTLLSITHLTDFAIGTVAHTALGRDLLHSLVQTLRYTLFFVLGIGLGLKGAAVGTWLRQRSRARLQLWVLAFALLALPYLAGYIELAYAVGATLLLALCMHSLRARQLLKMPVLAWLGRVSYSLYLVHLLVLLSLVHALHGVLPLPAILVLGVTLSLGAADLCNRLIELPANRLGKRLASYLKA
jgi:peptidoglycan/LPS O-acetylase OafA/YrhL